MRPRNPLALLFVVALALVASTATVEAQSKPKVAILGLEVIDSGSGIDPGAVKVAKALTDALRKRPVTGAGPYQKAPGSDKDLEEMKLVYDCGTEKNRCMAKIGGQLGADLLMYGKVQKRKEGYQVSIKLLDIDKRQLVRRITEMIELSATPERILHWSGVFYRRLSGQPDSGTLSITANVSDGEVYVDGDPKGSLEDGELTVEGITVGKHKVRIEADGHKPFEIEVQIGGGETVPMDANLESMAVNGIGPEKPGDGKGVWRITGLVLVAGTAVSAAVWGLSYKKIKDVEGDTSDIEAFNDVVETGMMVGEAMRIGPDDPCGEARDMGNVGSAADALAEIIKNCDDGESAASRANLFGAITIAAAAAAGFALYKGFTGGSSSQERASGKKKSKSRSVQVTPTITPTHVGAGVKIEF